MELMKRIGVIALLISVVISSSTNTMVMSSSNNTTAFNQETDYEVKKIDFHYAPVEGGGLDYYSVDVYYSQGYFEHPSTEYDSHLATASLALASSTFTPYTVVYDEDWYLNQSKYAKEFFEKIEFNTFEVNEDYVKPAEANTIGLCAAKKEYGDYTVVAVAPRSGGYYSEWAGNMHLGDGSKSDYMHEGWYIAANKLVDFLCEYVSKYVTGRVKIWMAGFSRGGATTNIAAALIDNKLNNGEKLFSSDAYTSFEDVYAYTFEAPQGANINSKTVKAPKDAIYDNIFNIVNPLDIVPKLAMKQYGFTRFGIDKYVTNKFYDPDNYENNRRTSNTFLGMYHQNPLTELKPDSFAMAGFEITNFGVDIATVLVSALATDYDLPTILTPFRDNTKKNYDANIASELLIEELVDNLGDRNKYVSKYQDKLERMMLLVQNEQNTLPGIMSTLLKIISISAFLDASSITSKFTKAAINSIWGDDFAAELYDLVTALDGPLASTYWEKPNELLSIGAYASYIVQNHYPETVFAHLSSQDSYYIDEYNQGKAESDKLQLVPLMDNADYVRMHFFGYNDIGLRLDSKKGQRVININGHVFGKSDVETCDDGYAAGYYSYATEEKIDIFMPANGKYNISMKSYSKKPYHRCEYWAYYEFLSLDNRGVLRKQLDHKKEHAYFNSDRHKRDVTIKL